MVAVRSSYFAWPWFRKQAHFAHYTASASLAYGLTMEGNAFTLHLGGDSFASVTGPRPCHGLNGLLDKCFVTLL